MKPVTSTPRQRPPTIRDVARHAGVSVATVSRVLNDSPLVTTGTRERVRAAIDELGFRRSSTARNLSVGRSQGIGVVAPFFTTPSVVERLRGVVGRLAHRGYDLLLFDVEAPEQRTDALRDFAQRDRVDGLLVISLPLSDEQVETLQRDDLPVVLVDTAHPRLPHVVIDDVHGGRLATEHLLAKGHRTIGFLGDLPDNPFGFTSSEHRREGYQLALRGAGIEADPELEQLGPYGLDEARPLAEALLRRDDPPTAIFAASDMQAIGVLQTADALGLRVPEDVAVIGFDDIDMAAILALTTVRQPLWETGAHGAELLLAAIEGGERQPIEQLEPLALVERRTT
jgi:LacI family transcriptional regulator/LacI family repressor for deo operon, udp, cdd, tsx, nupC, and nupG